MFRRAQNGKAGHTNLFIKAFDTYRIVAIYNKQTNKHVQLLKYTCDTGYMCMDLSFPVYFPLSNLKLYLILVFVMFFYCSKSIKVI